MKKLLLLLVSLLSISTLFATEMGPGFGQIRECGDFSAIKESLSSFDCKTEDDGYGATMKLYYNLDSSPLVPVFQEVDASTISFVIFEGKISETTIQYSTYRQSRLVDAWSAMTMRLTKERGIPNENDDATGYIWESKAFPASARFRETSFIVRFKCTALVESHKKKKETIKWMAARGGVPVIATAKVAANIRSGPSLQHKVVRRVEANKHVTVDKKEGDWFRVVAIGEEWVHESVVDVPLTEEEMWRPRIPGSTTEGTKDPESSNEEREYRQKVAELEAQADELEALGDMEYAGKIRAFLRKLESDEPETGSSVTSASGIEVQIKIHCQEEWSSDYRMQVHCIEKQQEAVISMADRQNRVSSAVLGPIRRNCADEWPDDFTMRDYCEKNQVDAYAKLH